METGLWIILSKVTYNTLTSRTDLSVMQCSNIQFFATAADLQEEFAALLVDYNPC